MKKTLILTVMVICATLLCGCQEQQQLADCQEQTAQLQQTIEQQEAAVAKANDRAKGAVKMVSELFLGDARIRRDLDTAKQEIEALKKENAGLKKDNAGLKKELSRTPEERANIRKGIGQLMQLQKESAEKLIKAKEAEEAGQN